MMASGWVGVAWITSERLATALKVQDGGAEAVAAVLRHQSLLPPGFTRDVTVDGDTVRLNLTAEVDGLLDATHPGVPGLLARGERGGLEAMAQAVDPRGGSLMSRCTTARSTRRSSSTPQPSPSVRPTRLR